MASIQGKMEQQAGGVVGEQGPCEDGAKNGDPVPESASKPPTVPHHRRSKRLVSLPRVASPHFSYLVVFWFFRFLCILVRKSHGCLSFLLSALLLLVGTRSRASMAAAWSTASIKHRCGY